MESARSRGVNWSKTDVATAVAETVAKSAPRKAEQQQATDVKQTAENVNSGAENSGQNPADVKQTIENVASNDGAKAEAGKSEAETAAKDADRFADNKLFTADKVAAARARMKSKFGQLNSGLDPELLIDGMTIAGAYIESGVRKFSDYARAMVDDFGDGVKPYSLS